MAGRLFVDHGGDHPQTAGEAAAVPDALGDRMRSMGAAVVDAGNPVGLSSAVNPGGSGTDNGGSKPASGCGLFHAARPVKSPS